MFSLQRDATPKPFSARDPLSAREAKPFPRRGIPTAETRPAEERSADQEEVRLAPELDLGAAALPWERQIGAVTAAQLSNPAKARMLLAMLPSLPEEALETSAREAADRLPDKDYSEIQGILLNPRTHGAVLSVFMADLLERPDSIALPVLLAIAQSPDHPYATAARDDLELLLGRDFGNDWTQWAAEVRHALATAL
jgi:hypothetical protein